MQEIVSICNRRIASGTCTVYTCTVYTDERGSAKRRQCWGINFQKVQVPWIISELRCLSLIPE